MSKRIAPALAVGVLLVTSAAAIAMGGSVPRAHVGGYPTETDSPARAARAFPKPARPRAPALFGRTPEPVAPSPSPAPTTVTPEGIPAAEVGSLVLNDSAADIWNTWDHTSPPAGADCATFGTVALSSAGLDLTTDGQFGNCAKITSTAAYGYGIFEARIWVQASSDGTIANWPAFYLAGPDWPVGGEIDGFEGMGGYDSASFHYGADDAMLTEQDRALQPGWNVVDVVWEPQTLVVYYNGQKFVTWDSPVITSQPMWITFDVTTGTDGDTTGQPSSMAVDYLRIWRNA